MGLRIADCAEKSVESDRDKATKSKKGLDHYSPFFFWPFYFCGLDYFATVLVEMIAPLVVISRRTTMLF